MAFDPHFGGPFEHPRTDEADLADRMFADDEERRRARAWCEAEGLDYLPSLEDQAPPELQFAAE